MGAAQRWQREVWEDEEVALYAAKGGIGKDTGNRGSEAGWILLVGRCREAVVRGEGWLQWEGTLKACLEMEVKASYPGRGAQYGQLCGSRAQVVRCSRWLVLSIIACVQVGGGGGIVYRG